MENLGKRAKDKITGLEGIIVARAVHLFGCATYALAPQVLADGKPVPSTWFDEGRIEIIGDGISLESVQVEKPGWDNLDGPNNRVR